MARVTRKPQTPQPEQSKKWSDIDGEMSVYCKVWTNEENEEVDFSYSVSVDRKKKDSMDYDNAYANVFFKTRPDDYLNKFDPNAESYKFKIKMEGFLTVYKEQIAVQVMKYEITEINGKPIHEFPAPF